jgi:hypothetical protein
VRCVVEADSMGNGLELRRPLFEEMAGRMNLNPAQIRAYGNACVVVEPPREVAGGNAQAPGKPLQVELGVLAGNRLDHFSCPRVSP